MQKVKNRIASQNTRDQRRKYITELEEVKIHLAKANEELNERNRLLEERLKAIENEKMVLFTENQELKRQNVLNTQAENFITYEATSPALSRSSSKGRSPSYKFFLGTFMAFAVYSVVNEVLAYREEAEKASVGRACKIATRTSRTEEKSLRVLHFFYAIFYAMLSILFICFFAVRNGERWKKNKNYSEIVARIKVVQEKGMAGLNNGRLKGLQSKVYYWYSKYNKLFTLQKILIK